jgi:hypothetical protein
MEMKRREMGDVGQCLEVQRLIEPPVDVLENSVHPTVILGSASGRRHIATVDISLRSTETHAGTASACRVADQTPPALGLRTVTDRFHIVAVRV